MEFAEMRQQALDAGHQFFYANTDGNPHKCIITAQPIDFDGDIRFGVIVEFKTVLQVLSIPKFNNTFAIEER